MINQSIRLNCKKSRTNPKSTQLKTLISPVPSKKTQCIKQKSKLINKFRLFSEKTEEVVEDEKKLTQLLGRLGKNDLQVPQQSCLPWV